MIEGYVQQCDDGAKTGRINAPYSMPWLVGLIDCRGDAEGDLEISALSYLNGFSVHRDQGYGKRIRQGNRGEEHSTSHFVLINSTSLEPVPITAGSRILS